MASFRTKTLAILSFCAAAAAAYLIGVVSAADAPAPSPASGTAVISAPVVAAVLLSSAAFLGALRA